MLVHNNVQIQSRDQIHKSKPKMSEQDNNTKIYCKKGSNYFGHRQVQKLFSISIHHLS